jgi:hypothetical protein
VTDPFDLEAQLLPEQLRRLLAHAALVVSLDRLLRSNIVDRLARFKSFDFEERPAPPAPSLEGPELDAALAENVETQFLEADDVAVVRVVPEHAVELCRRMPELLLGADGGVRLDVINDGERVLRKIGVAWARIDMDCNPDFDGRDVADDEILPGPSVLLRELRGAAALV